MAVAATGFFDGVHLGHRSVIEALLKVSRERGEQSLVLTFWPHPRTVLQNGARDLTLLTSQEEKIARLHELGVDKVEVIPFTREFAALDANSYLNLLARDYGVRTIILGYDNRFGSDFLTTSQICTLAQSLGIEVVLVEASTAEVEGVTISSTAIRKAIAQGRVEDAAAMLGYEYSLTGVVVGGNRMGRTIGFPTANMKLREPLKALPLPAAYSSRVRIGDRQFTGMTNIDHNGKIETHIFDFNEDIYGLDITVTFTTKIRDERSFASFEDLRTQLVLDMESAANVFKH